MMILVEFIWMQLCPFYIEFYFHLFYFVLDTCKWHIATKHSVCFQSLELASLWF